MRRGVHNTLCRFRINGDLLEQASETARLSGMTFSEYIRAALREKMQNKDLG